MPRKQTLCYFVFWCAHESQKRSVLQLTCFNSTVDRICASGFLLDRPITYFNYLAFLVHGHYSAFLLLDISSSWSLVDVSVTWHIQSMTITSCFSYSAFPTPVKTLYSMFLLLGVSRLPLHHTLTIEALDKLRDVKRKAMADWAEQWEKD